MMCWCDATTPNLIIFKEHHTLIYHLITTSMCEQLQFFI